MCWRSQRNSRALIRTSPGWQLVNSVLRIGVLYSRTKECKLVPAPSGHWELIHMARTIALEHALRIAPQCKFPQSKDKTGTANDKAHPHSCFVSSCANACVWERERACATVSLSTCGDQGSLSALATKKSGRSLKSSNHTHTQLKHFILKLHLRAEAWSTYWWPPHCARVIFQIPLSAFVSQQQR